MEEEQADYDYEYDPVDENGANVEQAALEF
jgi:hypothetical protein